MELKMALLLRHQPLVLTTGGYDTSEIMDVVAEAVNFARAAGGNAQILITLHANSEPGDHDGLKQNAQVILDGLAVEGEKLAAEMVRIDDRIVKLTVTAK